jgi:hypothetical protein
VLEQPTENRTRRPSCARMVCRVPNLAEDLGLAVDDGVQPGRYTEEVMHDVGVAANVRMTFEVAARDPRPACHEMSQDPYRP